MTITAVRPTPKMMPARRTVQVPTTAPKRPARPQQTSATKPVQPSATSTEETQQRPGESATRPFTPKGVKTRRPVSKNSALQRKLEEKFDNGAAMTAKEIQLLLDVRPDLTSKLQPMLEPAKRSEENRRKANRGKTAETNRSRKRKKGQQQ
ncbi:hypothetical protein [Shimazuella alba]|uniref:Uncharacterized protein n=1 Tax=Shimazuella alba TaxID=2690964 RepID=A0A6I4W2T6_9BACL|nr:hypothetical protein [Shimazuella alba]MXQ54572.1 hypothetical protein [Shimazuella alba]